METPTRRTYEGLEVAYSYFNQELFGGRLPRCLLTVRAHRRTYGYFSGDRFSTREGGEITDEIALNITHFKERSTQQILSTLVHEMVHAEQHHFGSPSRSGYHNAEWARWMERVGLMPSDTGEPGGKRTGQRVSHFIIPDGAFDRAYRAGRFEDLFIERTSERQTTRQKLKMKYTCPRCDLNAWAKPDVRLACVDCSTPMIAAYETKSVEMAA
jgi:predicted SprT family Zn-dependent metalloprotease